jgi:hypothetical protein
VKGKLGGLVVGVAAGSHWSPLVGETGPALDATIDI